MVKLRQYIETDVVTEARNRLRHVYATFDTVVVMFSGGKDSLAALHLTKEIAAEFGQDKVNVVFRDEELINQSVIDFVNEYRQLPWVDMRYYCVPLHSKKYVLGNVKPYIQWDKNRPHIRPIPEHALVLEPGDERVFDQYSMDAYVAANYKGKIAFVNGIRAAESLIRYRACVNKLDENYINAVEGADNVKLVKPIYDWEENDVFKFFMDNDIKYCPIYDSQLYADAGLRVSTPIHAEAAKSFHRLRAIDPVLYSQIIEIFPEMRVQELYFRDYDRTAVRNKYEKSFVGIKKWIHDTIEDPHEKALAMKRLSSVRSRHYATPESYSIDYIFKTFLAGGYKREIIPQSQSKRPRKK